MSSPSNATGDAPSQPRNRRKRQGSKKPNQCKRLVTAAADLANMHLAQSDKKKPTKEEPKTQIETSPEESDEDEDAEYCFICTDKIKIAAIYPCNHVTCHNCTLKLRGLMNNKHCTQCRTDRSEVMISKKIDKKFQDFTPEDRIYTNKNLGISFDDKETKDAVIGLLRFNCPMKCGQICDSWKELKRHVREKHQMQFCDLCTRNKKQFTHEFELYNTRDLLKHEREGDDKGFSGHPQCSFCHVRFYSGDELFVHLRDEHEKCHICTQINPQKPQYFNNYNSLEKHFRANHYACMVQSCIDDKFVVFRDEIDLRAHMVDAHPGIYGNSKTARTLDLNFEFNKGFGSQLSNGGGSNNNNKGKKKANTSNNDNGSSSGPSGGNSIGPTSSTEFPALGRQRQQFSSLSASFGQPNTPAPAPQETSIDIAKRRLDERVRNALNYDSTKFSQFEAMNKRFLDSQLDAQDLLTGYKRMFPNVNNIEMESMINDFSKINFKATGRISKLKQAWEDQNKNQQFPSLGGGISQRSTGSGAWASQGSGKKGRNNALVGDTRDAAFPSLPPARKPNVPPVSAPVSRSGTPNFLTLRVANPTRSQVSSTSNTSAASSTPRNYAAPPQRTFSTPSITDEHFPALPQVKPKPKFTQPKPRVVERDENLVMLRPPRNQDDFGYESSSSQASTSGGGGKKGKGKKQILFQVGR